MESVVRGGTKWKRFAVVMVPSVAATAVIGMALAQGALAASFAVSGQDFKVTVKHLEGKGFLQYGALDVKHGGGTEPVAVSAFKSADLTDMCQSVVTDLGPLGKVTLRLNAGGGGTPVHAENLYIDLNQLHGDAVFEDINIGIAAGASKQGPGMKGGNEQSSPGGFAQEARTATLDNVEQTAWATSAATFKLSGLKLNVKRGDNPCY